jgi:transcriptional regulator with XRE-family HTH domain
MLSGMTLDLWLTLAGMTEEAFAARIRSTQYSVNRYRRGKRIPRPKAMRAIALATGFQVQAADFYSQIEAAEGLADA